MGAGATKVRPKRPRGTLARAAGRAGTPTAFPHALTQTYGAGTVGRYQTGAARSGGVLSGMPFSAL